MNLKQSLVTVLIFSISIISAQQIGDGHAPATIANFSSPLKSGIYNGLNTSTTGMAPDNSSVWQHLFVSRHISATNNYQLQMASSFTVNDRLFFRKIGTSNLSALNTDWVELATRANNKFEGNQVIIGSLGIGTATPLAKLEINEGNVLVRNLPNVNNESAIMISHSINAGNLDTFGTSIRSITESGGDNTYGMQFFTQASFRTNQTEKLRILGNGNVGIGVTNLLNKLDVNGTIHSREVKVDLDGWADFVFKKEYNLPTLEEVEKHIKEKGHLENIPSEEEVLKNGINLGEMNAKLLQKIEELTLYVIEQEKKNNKHSEEIERSNKEIELLKNENKTFKSTLEKLSEKQQN